MKDDYASGFLRLSKESAISVGLVIVLIGGAVWINSSIAGLAHAVDKLRIQVENQARNGALKGWIRLFRAENKGKDIKVPDLEG